MASSSGERLPVLRAGALGSFGVAALGAVMMSPALGIYANLGLISASSGKTAPAEFLAALLLTLPTAISYALIAREIPSAGSAYTWLSESITPLAGPWIGLLLVATYFLSVLLQPILFGLFFNELLVALFGYQVGYSTWLIGIFISTAMVALLVYPGVEVSARGSITLTVVEAVVVLALAGTILVACLRHGQIQYAPFNPATSLNGGHGFSQGLIFALLSFGGFGVITTAAEETHSPREIIPRALVLACVFLGLFWALTAWTFSMVFPAQAWASYVAKGTNPVAVIAREYWGAGSVIVVVTALTAALGVYLASIVGYARVAYAMGRDGTLPAFFGRLHAKYQTPWNAQHVVILATLSVTALWGRWLGLYLSYDWWGTAVVFFWVVSNIFVNMGCAVFFYRFRHPQFSWGWHGLVPFLGVITSSLPLYYSFGPDLWNAGWKAGQSVILFCVAVVILSAAYTIWLGHARPEVLQRPGAK
jgi:amino acid transporter